MPKTPEELEKEIADLKLQLSKKDTELGAQSAAHAVLENEKNGLAKQLETVSHSIEDSKKIFNEKDAKIADLSKKIRENLETAVHGYNPTYDCNGKSDEWLTSALDVYKEEAKKKKPETNTQPATPTPVPKTAADAAKGAPKPEIAAHSADKPMTTSYKLFGLTKTGDV